MTGPGLDLHLPAEVGSVQVARHAIRELLVGRVDQDTQMDAELLVSELVTNGVLHGPAGNTWIEIHLRLDPRGVTIEVADAGAGFDPELIPDPDPHRPGGWGLALVERLADQWGTRRQPAGTAVWFRLERLLAPTAL